MPYPYGQGWNNSFLPLIIFRTTVKRSNFRNKEMRWLNATSFFPFRDGGNGRNGDLRGTHSIVAIVATVAPYSVTATAGSSTTM